MTFQAVVAQAHAEGKLTVERLLDYIKVHVEQGSIDLDDFVHVILDL